jgi:hypothetical protein
LWAGERRALGGSSKTAADLRLTAYIFFLIAAWFICGALGQPFLRALEGVPAVSPIHIMVFLVLGWLFLFLSHYQSRKPRSSGGAGSKAATLSGAALLALALLPGSSRAQENPIQIALIGPTMQLVDDDEDVKGIRLNFIYGVNRDVSGLDLGLINHTRGDMTGVEFGVVNVTDGDLTGWQAGVVNVTQGQFTGLQWAPWMVLSLANFAEAAEGAQIAWAFNRADYMRGFQLSLVNVAEDMYGVQVGLINIIRSKPDLSILPIVNWKFE